MTVTFAGTLCDSARSLVAVTTTSAGSAAKSLPAAIVVQTNIVILHILVMILSFSLVSLWPKLQVDHRKQKSLYLPEGKIKAGAYASMPHPPFLRKSCFGSALPLPEMRVKRTVF
jgi:hypothetical protein